MSDEEEDDGYTEPCDCGHEFCDGYKFMQLSPYGHDVHDDTTLYLMCSGDAYESAQDI